MVKSMFAGVAGLKAHQGKMDVIGNNIANVNTWGYKSYSYNFMDSIYTTSINSSGGAVNAGGMGGRNPSQVGYGSQIASISFQYTSGAPAPSENELDCMIDGTGLFLVGGMINGGVTDVKGSGLYLSRVGMFSPDNNGYVVDSQKNYVYGYAVKEGTGLPETPATAAEAKIKNAQIELVFDQTDNTKIVALKVAGVEKAVTANYDPTANTNKSNIENALTQWAKKMNAAEKGKLETNPPPEAIVSYSIDNSNTNMNPPRVSLTITATNSGSKGDKAVNEAAAAFQDVAAGGAGGNAADTVKMEKTITPAIDYKAGVDAEFEETLSPLQIPTDPNTYTQYNIQSWSVSELGVISGVDINNRPIVIGQIALVAVENPNGLVKTSGYYFSVGDNAGDAVAMRPDGGQVGSIRSKFLEMPNTDLANEFSNMITTQRGFQANSKIITVTDEMLQELVNMKR